jgi:hypothetical protein
MVNHIRQIMANHIRRDIVAIEIGYANEAMAFPAFGIGGQARLLMAKSCFPISHATSISTIGGVASRNASCHGVPN